MPLDDEQDTILSSSLEVLNVSPDPEVARL